MKRTLIAITILAILFGACRKRTERENCYLCTRNDSMYSNIPIYVNTHYYRDSGGRCKLTNDMKNLLENQNTYVDTFLRGDTFKVAFWTMKCELY